MIYRLAKKKNLKAEINVVPYIDVMLVLLIIFMVLSPLLIQGIEVNLPKTDTTKMSVQSEPLVISINKDGNYFINIGDESLSIDLNELKRKSKVIFDANPEIEVVKKYVGIKNEISIENLSIASNTDGDMPNGTFDIVVDSDYDIGGFQFEVYGATIDSFSGGAADQNGFSTSASSTTVIGFSLTGDVIPQGEYTLLSDVSFFDSQSLGKICISDGVIADVQAQQIPVIYGDCQSLFVQMPGDLNHDGLVDVLDVILTVSQIIDESTIDQEDLWIIDLNDDMEINISDVIMLINIICF